MMREPVATAQMREARALVNILMKNDFMSLSFSCMDTRMQENRGFAQSTLFNVDSHGVGSEL